MNDRIGWSSSHSHILKWKCITERRTSLYVSIHLKTIVNLVMTGPGKIDKLTKLKYTILICGEWKTTKMSQLKKNKGYKKQSIILKTKYYFSIYPDMVSKTTKQMWKKNLLYKKWPPRQDHRDKALVATSVSTLVKPSIRYANLAKPS